MGRFVFVEVRDYQTGKKTALPSGAAAGTIQNPRGDLLIYVSDPASPVRVQIAGRPSGTEPKIKFYLFCQSDLNPGTSLDQARLVGDSVLREVQKALGDWAAAQLKD